MPPATLTADSAVLPHQMRLFFAVDLPDSVTDDVAALQEPFEAAPGLNFTDPAQAHVTLKFLGESDEDRLSEVKSAGGRAVDDADLEPFEAAVGGLGVFPDLEYISVLWTGFREGGDELATLHDTLEVETVALGFDPEPHVFTPHVTLARMEHAGGKELVQERVRETDPDVGRFRVEEVRLKESELTAEGPSYRTVARFPL